MAEMESGHTPTPWGYDGEETVASDDWNGHGYAIFPVNKDGECIGHIADIEGENPEADAAFIVRAVNSHDSLVAALNGTLGLIRRAQETLCTYLHPDSPHDDRETMNTLLEMFDGPRQREIETTARAALALVESK